ncbi:MAG TPA: oligosaccharide flippase family protein [Terriglobia bacterium]|jgi:PST family polysaccharide transporter|nr:oligosaccharide flippase family protein [Terriglobia bacterium]
MSGFIEGLAGNIQVFRLNLRRLLSGAVARNALSLYSIRFANYILPLITVPYLVRVLGAEEYGLLGFAQGLVAYFSVFVDYGFDWSATRIISVERENRESVSRTAMGVWGAKFILLSISIILLLPVTLFVTKVRGAAALVWIVFASLAGKALFPTWLYQGLERMTGIAIINISVRSAGLIALILFVKQPKDLLLCAWILTIQSFFAGLLGVGWATFRLKIRWTLPGISEIWDSLKNGLALFLSASATTLYTSGNAFLLGLLVRDFSTVGYYVAAERLVRAAIDAMGPISQAFFPKVANLAHASKELALREGRRILSVLAPLGAGTFVFTFVLAPEIVRIIFGSKFMPAVNVVRVLSLCIPNVALATVWSTLMMLSFKRDYAVLIILFLAGILNIALALLLAPIWGANGMATGVVMAETFVNAASFIYTLKHGLNPARFRPAYVRNS